MAGRNVSVAMKAGAVFVSAALAFGLVPTRALAESAIELGGSTVEYGSSDSGIVVEDYDPIVVEGSNELVVEGSDGYGSYDDTIVVEGGDSIAAQGYESYEMGDYAAAGDGLMAAQADPLPKYKVTFDANGGTFSDNTASVSQDVEEGSKATDPGTPARDGWDFAGWYRTSTPTAADTPVDLLAEGISGDETLYAGWKAELSVKTYDRTSGQFSKGGTVSVDDGTASADVKESVFDGAQVQLGAQADGNYRLVGWSTDESDPGNHVKSSASDYSLTFDGTTKTVVAVFGEQATVTYDVNGGTPGSDWKDSIRVDVGSNLYGTVPNPPASSFAAPPQGSMFAGIEVNIAGTIYTYEAGQAIDPVKITGDTTITYLWRMPKVTFVDEDGTTILKPTAEYAIGSNVDDIAPADPQKQGNAQYTFRFSGWTPNDAKVTGDATYKATYSKTTNKYEVKFVNYNGTLLKTSKVAYGSKPTAPTLTPKKASTSAVSYVFTGWTSKDGKFYREGAELADVTGPTQYTATFDEVANPPQQVTLNFQLNNGTLDGETGVYTTTANVGDKMELPTPTLDGRPFSYWYSRSQGARFAPGDEYEVTGNDTLLAIWGASYSSATDDSGVSTVTTSTISGSGTGSTTGGTTTGTTTTSTVTPGGTTRTTSTIGSSSGTGTTNSQTTSTIGSSSTAANGPSLSQTGDPQAHNLASEALFAIGGVLLIVAGYELTKLRKMR